MYLACASPGDVEIRRAGAHGVSDLVGIVDTFVPIVDHSAGDQSIVGPGGEANIVRRADGGFAILVTVLDGGPYAYHRPVAAPSAYLLQQPDGGWTPVGRIADGGTVGFRSQLINLADAGWVSETPLLDGGRLRVPAATPPGY